MQKSELTRYTIIIFLYFLVFQELIQTYISPFSYFDEGLIVLFFGLVIYKCFDSKVLMVYKSWFVIIIFGILFVASGAISTKLNSTQCRAAVILDFITNIKFFCAMGVSAFFFKKLNPDDYKVSLKYHVELITYLLFGLLLINKVIRIFPTSADGNIITRKEQLFYMHSTALAAISAFLICVLLWLMEFYDERKFIAMNMVLAYCTGRTKVITWVCLMVFVAFYVIKTKRKIKLKMLLFIGIAAIGLSWQKIYLHFFYYAGESARSQLLKCSAEILVKEMPWGMGFGTFGSNASAVYYSQVYIQYGCDQIYGMTKENPSYVCDSFWPMIMGQFGLSGTIMFALILGWILVRIGKIQNSYRYLSCFGAFAYLLISSSSESAFVNPITIPLAMWIGIWLNHRNDSKGT